MIYNLTSKIVYLNKYAVLDTYYAEYLTSRTVLETS